MFLSAKESVILRAIGGADLKDASFYAAICVGSFECDGVHIKLQRN
jgi:hypothetical protein